MPSPVERKDYYKVLEIQRGASKDEIRAAYRKMALKWHPDRHTVDKENASQKFIEIHDAYKLLTARKDRHRSHHPKHPGDGQKSSGSPPARQSRTDSCTTPSTPKPTTPTTHSATPSPPEQQHAHTPPSHDHNIHSDYTSPESAGCPDDTPFSSARARPIPTADHPHHSTPFWSSKSSSAECSSSPSSTSSSSRSSSRSRDSHSSPPSSPGSDAHGFPSCPAHPPPSETPKPKPARAKLRKQSKPPLDRKSAPLPKRRRADYGTTKNASSRSGDSDDDNDSFVHVSDTSCPPPPPPTWGSKAKGKKKEKEHECKFCIALTLEDFFHGARRHYRFSRQLLSGKRKPVMLDVDIPPGCRPGTKIRYPGVGHERRDGTLQDVVIVIEQVPHERFARERCDLILDVELPWVKALEDEERVEVFFEGLLDGEAFEFAVDCQADKSLRGSHVFPGAGMPVREGRRIVGRGDLIVRWEIAMPSASKWDTLKKAFYFDR